MKPKNVMLLGFVNRAVEYLDKHMDEQPDTRLAELKNIDLASLKDELTDNLDVSLGTMQSTMATLLKAGNEAFDNFIDETNGKPTIVNEFDRIFDVSLNGEGSKLDNQKQLAKLLSFYNLDNDFEFGTQEINIPDLQEYAPAVEEKPVEAIIDDQKDLAEYDETVFDQEPVEEETKFETTPEDDEFLQEIIKNATSDDIAINSPVEETVEDGDAIDSIFSEIVENEDVEPAEELEEEVSEQVEEVSDDVQEEISEPTEKGLEETKQEQATVVSTPLPTIIESPALEKAMAEQETVVKQAPVQVAEEPKQEVKPEPVNEKSYVSSLIDDLKVQLQKEEVSKKQNEDKYQAICERISGLYPYLPNGFIRTVYEIKDELASEYPLGKKTIVLHRISFKDVDSLRKFVEICLNHEYQINADENKKIVDIFREFVNSDGKILSNIYEVANQGYLLNGNYEGYNVIINE